MSQNSPISSGVASGDGIGSRFLSFFSIIFSICFADKAIEKIRIVFMMPFFVLRIILHLPYLYNIFIVLWDSIQMPPLRGFLYGCYGILHRCRPYGAENKRHAFLYRCRPYEACFIDVMGFYTDAEEIRKIPKQKHPKRFYKYATPTGLYTERSARPL